MKTISRILTLLLIWTSCEFRPKSPDQMMKQIREDFTKEAEITNVKTLAWGNFVDSLYKLADTNQVRALRVIDNLISKDTSINRHQISELHFIKGDIFYRIDSLQQALNEFSTSGQEYEMSAPKHLAARAGVYVKLKQYDNAFADLSKASEINYDYLWNLGNFYEVTLKKDSAISCYNRLYNHDTTTYKFCLNRVNKLKNSKTKLLSELIYRDRKRIELFIKGIK